MTIYTAIVNFVVQEFTADTMSEANDRINVLIDELSKVKTGLGWDDVDWYVREETNTENKGTN